ncbi:MAG: helix-turn-helix transcriptional regulator [Kofleriaceae bacterium]|nr:helix-turn-helix transcriptional regulator [Kofleriaceae bacterium]
MRAAADADDYRADPAGAYLVGGEHLVFCARPTLWGFALWGRPGADALARLVGLLALELRAPTVPHASLADLRRVDAVDPAAFAAIGGYVEAHFAALARQVTRLAIVHGPGLVGAAVAGFFQVQRAPYPVRVFDDAAAAAAWVDGDDGALAAIDAAIAAARGVAPVVGELRRWLEARLVDATLPAAAKALARSPRSLQRALHDAGTTFQRELEQARVRVAQRLLEATDASLTAIALDVGCASPQHFSALFRRVAGVAPSAWRARVRDSAPR